MGKTQKRNNNVSQKKRSPVRTSLKLRKEKKMKGGEVTDTFVDDIKTRAKNTTAPVLKKVEAIVKNINENINESSFNNNQELERIIEKKQEIKNRLIDYYNHKNADFKDKNKVNDINNIRTFVNNIINELNSIIPPSQDKKYSSNNDQSIINGLNELKTIMNAVLEGIASAEELSNMNKEDKNVTADKSNTNITGDDKSDDKSDDESDDKSDADATDADATDADDGITDQEFDQAVNDQFEKAQTAMSNILSRIKDTSENKNMVEQVFETVKKILSAYLVKNKKISNENIEQNKILNQQQIDELNNPNRPFIISENEFTTTINELRPLLDTEKVFLLFPVLDNSMAAQPVDASSIKEIEEANIQIDENRNKFVENVKYLLNLVTKIKEKITFATTTDTENLFIPLERTIKLTSQATPCKFVFYENEENNTPIKEITILLSIDGGNVKVEADVDGGVTSQVAAEGEEGSQDGDAAEGEAEGEVVGADKTISVDDVTQDQGFILGTEYTLTFTDESEDVNLTYKITFKDDKSQGDNEDSVN